MSEDVAQTRKFTADEVMAMVRHGILDEDERLELIEGALVVKEPQDPPHASTTARVTRLLGGVRGTHVRPQMAVAAERHSLPEPDVALCRGEERDFARRHPAGRDLLLAVEVSCSSLRHDERKAQLYARAGVAEYWILDLRRGGLVVHERPSAFGYGSVRELVPPARVPIPGSDRDVGVAELLGG